MRTKIQLGFDVKGNPIYYSPSQLETESESVFIYGKNEMLKDAIVDAIVSNTIENDRISWLIISDLYPPKYEMSRYKIPIRVAEPLPMREYLGWDEVIEGIYGIAYTKFKKLKKKTFEDFSKILRNVYSEIIGSDEFLSADYDIDAILSDLENVLSFTRGSVIAIDLFTKIIGNDKGKIVIKTPKSRREATALFFLLSEIYSTIRNTRLRGFGGVFGILFDNIQALAESVMGRRIIHDFVFSWGRALQIVRIVVARGDKKVNPLFDDGIGKNGGYSMVIRGDDFVEYDLRIGSPRKRYLEKKDKGVNVIQKTD